MGLCVKRRLWGLLILPVLAYGVADVHADEIKQAPVGREDGKSITLGISDSLVLFGGETTIYAQLWKDGEAHRKGGVELEFIYRDADGNEQIYNKETHDCGSFSLSLDTASPGRKEFEVEADGYQESYNTVIYNVLDFNEERERFPICHKQEIGGSTINLVSGNMSHNVVRGVDIPDPGPNLSFQIMYNSLSADYHGTPGQGWTHSYSISLTEDSGGNVIYQSGGGDFHFFKLLADGSYEPPRSIHPELVKNSDGTWSLTGKHGTRHDFCSKGRLTAVTDRNDNQKTLNYDGYLLSTITDSSGRKIKLSYYSDSHLKKINDPADREIGFSYDENGNLTDITDLAGNTITCVYDTNHNLVINQIGHSTYWEYDDQNRVTKAWKEGGQNEITINYKYDSMTTEYIHKYFTVC